MVGLDKSCPSPVAGVNPTNYNIEMVSWMLRDNDIVHHIPLGTFPEPTFVILVGHLYNPGISPNFSGKRLTGNISKMPLTVFLRTE